jgi:hypothetical protein
MNAGRLSADAMQALMRHRSYKTTQGYINLAPQYAEAMDRLHVQASMQRQAGSA